MNRDLAKERALMLVKLAKEAELTNHIIDGLDLLQNIYAHQYDFKSFDEVKEELKYYHNLKEYENRAFELYGFCIVALKRSVSSRKRNLENTIKIINKIHKYWDETKSHNIFELYYKLKMIYLEFVGRFSEIIKLSNEANSLVSASKINPNRFNFEYNKFIVSYAYLKMRKYSEGLDYAQKHFLDFRYTSRAWFAFVENYFLLAMHAKNYKLAYDLNLKLWLNPNISKINIEARERWELFTAFLYFLYQQEKLKQHFDYDSFVSMVPIQEQDKLGFNVSILILQFLKFLGEGNKMMIQNRTRAMEQYANKYLSGIFTKRSRYFYRLLRMIVTCRFDYQIIVSKTQNLFEKLQHTPVPGDAYAQVEVVPYEHLWEHILEVVKEKQREFKEVDLY